MIVTSPHLTSHSVCHLSSISPYNWHTIPEEGRGLGFDHTVKTNSNFILLLMLNLTWWCEMRASGIIGLVTILTGTWVSLQNVIVIHPQLYDEINGPGYLSCFYPPRVWHMQAAEAFFLHGTLKMRSLRAAALLFSEVFKISPVVVSSGIFLSIFIHQGKSSNVSRDTQNYSRSAALPQSRCNTVCHTNSHPPRLCASRNRQCNENNSPFADIDDQVLRFVFEALESTWKECV